MNEEKEMEKVIKIVMTAAAGVTAAVFMLIGLLPKDHGASWYHTDRYGYVEADGEYSYTAPVHRAHIRFDEESGTQYADNELLIQLRSTFPEETARTIAEDRDAQLTGFSSASGTCQWRFDRSYTLEELWEKAEELTGDNEIEGAYVNQILTDMEPAAASKTVYKDWEQSLKGWGYTAISAAKVREYNDDIENGVNVGILDSGFQKHEDLDMTFEGSSNDEDDGDHGAFVSGVIAAECTGDDECGMEGVYSRLKHRGDVIGRCWKDVNNHRSLPLSGMLHQLSALFLQDCQVICLSFACCSEAAYTIMEEPDGNLAKTHFDSAKACELFLRGYMDKGYEFLLVQAAGNASLRKSSSSFEKNKKISRGEYPYRLTEEEDGEKDDDSKDEEETEDPDDLTTEIIRPEDASLFAAIEGEKVADRILVVGGFDNQFGIYQEGCSGERIDVMAPAVGIYSTRNRTLVSQDGTSAAAAYVAGTLAAMWSLDPSREAEKVRDDLKQACETVPHQDIMDPQTQIARPAINAEVCMKTTKNNL